MAWSSKPIFIDLSLQIYLLKSIFANLSLQTYSSKSIYIGLFSKTLCRRIFIDLFFLNLSFQIYLCKYIFMTWFSNLFLQTYLSKSIFIIISFYIYLSRLIFPDLSLQIYDSRLIFIRLSFYISDLSCRAYQIFFKPILSNLAGLSYYTYFGRLILALAQSILSFIPNFCLIKSILSIWLVAGNSRQRSFKAAPL